MAGFFGLFDYSKPGPGVSKNEPEKKRFFVFWELYARKFFRLVIANLLYVLVSLPVITGGLAEAGLTFVTRNYVREKNVFLPEDFFSTIKKNWKQALGMQIIDIVALIFIGVALWFYGAPLFTEEGGGFISMLLFAVMLLITFTWRVMRYFVYMQMITFRMTLKQIIKNSLKFVVIAIKQNLLISLILLLVYAVLGLIGFVLYPLSLAIVLIIWVLFIPAFRSFLIQFMIFPVIKKTIIDPYYAEHPDEDVQARRDLNIETGEQTVEEETIFEDRGRTETAVAEESVIPKQYTADEMRRGKRFTKQESYSDDDGTI